MVKELKAAPEDSVRCLAYSQEDSLPNNNNNLRDSVALVKLPSRSPLSHKQGLELPKAVFSVSRPSRLKDSLGLLHRLKVSAQVLEAAYSALLVALVASVNLNSLPKPQAYSVANKQRNPKALLECS